MIKRTLKNNIVLSIKRNTKKELLIVLSETDVPELAKNESFISKIGLNHEQCLEIHGNTPTDVVEYTLGYNPDIPEIIQNYQLEDVVLGLVKNDNSLENIKFVFQGLLKIYPRMVGNVNG